MKITNNNHTTVFEITGEFAVALPQFDAAYETYENQNLIVDVTAISVDKNIIKALESLSKKHKKQKKSFVIVAKNLDFNKITTKISIVPTVQEAHDTIELEEIERDLGF
jgi:anti-anti-sigma regulatory factor